MRNYIANYVVGIRLVNFTTNVASRENQNSMLLCINIYRSNPEVQQQHCRGNILRSIH
jgi:hypothetical protein